MTTTDQLTLTKPPAVDVTMGIRRPPSDVFSAFVDPSITTRFWIANSTGELEPDRKVRWVMPEAGAEADVIVKAFETDERIVFDWGDGDEFTTVEIRFDPWGDEGTRVHISETGLTGTGDEQAARAADSTGGFTMVLCSLKALLEHDISLEAVNDRTATDSD